ncbi:MAG: ATP-binding cassette domain-containing protein, partial [Planctomycetes bacterium]|nr:ATP-binding cassette domain-containing protein [Planctomycetota bacterium]
ADFINSLPEGYLSCVGERGVRLSGGQRQRIGIARALYKNASILVLDEATSALDIEIEQSLTQTLDQLSRGLTIIVVAHRISSTAFCSRTIRVDAGSLQEIPLSSRHCDDSSSP